MAATFTRVETSTDEQIESPAYLKSNGCELLLIVSVLQKEAMIQEIIKEKKGKGRIRS